MSKDIEPIRATLGRLLATGKPVVALVSDLDAAARSAYVGIDDRAAGQLAGFLLGRCLERVPRAEVAVIVGALLTVVTRTERCDFAHYCDSGFRRLNSWKP